MTNLLRSPLRSEFDLKHLSTTGPAGVWRHVRQALRLAGTFSTILTVGPALVHLNPSFDARSILRDSLLAVVARARGARVVVQFHGGYPSLPRMQAKSTFRFLHLLLRCADAVLVLNGVQLRELALLQASARPKLVKIPYPISTADYADIAECREPRSAERPITVLFNSRLVRAKGAFDVVGAAALLHQQAVRVQFVLSGSGEETELKAMVERLGLREVVDFPGWVSGDARYQLLANADIFVLPTTLPEGLPLALLEAMASGLPVILCDTHGTLADVVVHGQNGLLAAPSDPASVADAIRTLVDRPELARRMGAMNRRLAEQKYDMPVIVESYARVYRRLLGIGPRVSQEHGPGTRAADGTVLIA